MILKTSGIPLFSRCYGGKTSKLHPDHALQSGFLAALYSFAKESFNQSGIKSVLFHDLKLDFKVDEDKEIIIVFVNPIKEDSNKIANHLDKIYKFFIEKHSNKIDSIFVAISTFVVFDKDLLNSDIVPRESVGEVKLQKHTFWEKMYKRLKRKMKK
ncbi:MAG: hypothetical protein EAX90_01425 [Candidatus Heimdallarchaeota archaeon]|nr:hypothetical protein [Candidatus Heimdallarchaeota archaeon]